MHNILIGYIIENNSIIWFYWVLLTKGDSPLKVVNSLYGLSYSF